MKKSNRYTGSLSGGFCIKDDRGQAYKDVAKKRIVRMGNVAERELMVGSFYGNCSEPDSESCVRSAA